MENQPPQPPQGQPYPPNAQGYPQQPPLGQPYPPQPPQGYAYPPHPQGQPYNPNFQGYPQQPGFVHPGQQFVQPKKKMPGCAIAAIFMILAVPAIAVVAAIAIPSLQSARTKANEKAAVQVLKNFHTASLIYINEGNGTYWKNGTTNFEGYFEYSQKKHGYYFYYFSNGGNFDEPNEATAFAFIAVPISRLSGREMFGIDESGEIYATRLSVEETLYLPRPDWNLTWEVDDSGIPSRLPQFYWHIK